MSTLGRPSSFKEEYCDIAIDFMSKGFSQTALAGHLSISKDTLFEWIKLHPNFADAINIAKPKRVEALERTLLTTESSAVVNARKFALLNADAKEWRCEAQLRVGNIEDETLKIETIERVFVGVNETNDSDS